MTADSVQYEIRVICKDSGHAPRVPDIAAFVYANPGWEASGIVTRRNPIVHADDTVQPRQEFDTDSLLGDVAYSTQKHGRAREEEFLVEGRRRYSLKCRLCGVHVVANEENLAPALDKLRLANIRILDLVALDRILLS